MESTFLAFFVWYGLFYHSCELSVLELSATWDQLEAGEVLLWAEYTVPPNSLWQESPKH